MTSKWYLLICLLISITSYAQILSGKVLDAKTNEPLETVAVYFDNTTIGTTTDEKGEFSLEYTEALQSTLVISYLGYDKVYISDFRQKESITISLVEAKNELDEVYIEYDDELTRRQKLKLFKDQFLGSTKLGKSCKILNEDDIYLRYNKNDKTLSASSKGPVIIYNKALDYEISYDLNDFEMQFRYVDAKSNKFTLNTAYYLGTMYFKDLNTINQKRSIVKKREKAFKGSIQHFMRALYNEDLGSQNYTVFKRGFKVNGWDHIEVIPIENSNRKNVFLKGKISILYNKKVQSDMFLDKDIKVFSVDAYGHYTPIVGVYFTGYMNEQRIGDMLPLDYGLK
jgi:hypothetical protein